jgi:hypothetical protein
MLCGDPFSQVVHPPCNCVAPPFGFLIYTILLIKKKFVNMKIYDLVIVTEITEICFENNAN